MYGLALVNDFFQTVSAINFLTVAVFSKLRSAIKLV